MLAEAEVLLGSGDLVGAAGIAESVLAGDPDISTRVDATMTLATALMRRGEPEDAFSVLAAEARLAEAVDPARSATLRAYSSNLHMLRFEADGALESAYSAREIAREGGIDVPVGVPVAVAIAEVLNGLPTADHALDVCVSGFVDGRDRMHMGATAWQLVVRERWDDARSLIDRALLVTDRDREPAALAIAIRARAELALREGAWARARADLLEAIGLHRRGSHVTAEAYAFALLARLDALEGRHEDCQSHVEIALELARGSGALGFEAAAHAALGLDALGGGEYQVAADELDRAEAVIRRGRLIEPAFLPSAGDHVEALMRADRRDEAERALGDLQRRAAASGLAWGRAVALRCEGLLMLREDVEEVFESALAIHDEVREPFERARTELLFGERLRRARRRGEARVRLRAALEVFEGLGALPWSERARNQLRASGVGRRRTGILLDASLTEQELRVAKLAAEGSTNREIAASLFISAKTVEFHLGNVYRKLGVRGRTELARMIGGSG
jgi:DNA-binding CsgD family transcriptional regulator